MTVSDIALTLDPLISAQTAIHLLNFFGSAENIYSASLSELTEGAELNDKIASRINSRLFHKDAEEEIEYCRKNNIEILTSDCDHYPHLLKECNDYPHVLFLKGNKDLFKRKTISIVGTRKASDYGMKVCESIVKGLNEKDSNIVVVSGLAYGIDAAAHRACVMHGSPTVAVYGTPVSKVYPSDHATLAGRIIEKGGAIISEYHSRHKTIPQCFVARNRIIAGVSMGTLIVESPEKGGSLTTAGIAESYFRNVMAIPGRINDKNSEGANNLIKRNIARMVCSVDDIMNEMGWDATITPNVMTGELSTTKLSDEEKYVLDQIPESEPIYIDDIAVRTSFDIPYLSSIIFSLLIEGIITELPGKRYQRNL